MRIITTMALKVATSGLTGHRERDIAYLQEMIREYGDDDTLVAVLKNIMGCLTGSEIRSVSV